MGKQDLNMLIMSCCKALRQDRGFCLNEMLHTTWIISPTTTLQLVSLCTRLMSPLGISLTLSTLVSFNWECSECGSRAGYVLNCLPHGDTISSVSVCCIGVLKTPLFILVLALKIRKPITPARVYVARSCPLLVNNSLDIQMSPST